LLASVIIRSHIDSLKTADEENDDEDLSDDGLHAESHKPTFFRNVYLGAPQKPSFFDAVQKAHSDDPVFCQFQARFAKALNELLRQDDSPMQLLNGAQVSVPDENFVSYLFIHNRLFFDHIYS
jgi:hypothetical protein